MTKRAVLVAILALAIPCAFAQYGQPSGASGQSAQKAGTENPPLKTIRGTISPDGKTFTPDKGKDTWTLKNPEDVKGHEGHHVDLNAHVYKDTHELHVMNVTMVGDKK
jgi:hypothetical protein